MVSGVSLSRWCVCLYEVTHNVPGWSLITAECLTLPARLNHLGTIHSAPQRERNTDLSPAHCSGSLQQMFPLSGPETSQTVYLLMPSQVSPSPTPLLYLSFSALVSLLLSVLLSACVYLSFRLSPSFILSLSLSGFLLSYFPLLYTFFSLQFSP